MKIKSKYLIIMLLIQIVFIGCSANMQSINKDYPDRTKEGEIIFIFSSVSCRCTLSQCNEMKENITEIIESLSEKEKSKIKLTELDYGDDTGKINAIVKKGNE